MRRFPFLHHRSAVLSPAPLGEARQREGSPSGAEPPVQIRRCFSLARRSARLSRTLALAGSISFWWASDLHAKNHGYSTPNGRQIYGNEETFEQIARTDARFFVVEAVTGVAPQGNLAILLGVINQPLRGVEFYLGYGAEANPARTYNADLRYLFNIDGYRPFIDFGYSYRHLTALGLHSHNLFAETGYKWVFRPTYHITLAVGVRHAVKLWLIDSPLSASDTDQDELDAQLALAEQWTPTLALKFSRAF